MTDTVIPFVRKSIEVNMTMLAIFEHQLGLSQGELLRLHSLDGPCGGEARCIKTPPNQSTAGVGAHTDFGTLVSVRFMHGMRQDGLAHVIRKTFLHNRLGGLQVMPPGSQRWLYIRVSSFICGYDMR